MERTRRHRQILSVVAALLVLLPAAKAQRPLRSGSRIRHKTSSVYLGTRGGVAASCYRYTELDDETPSVPLAWDYGMCLEWRPTDRLSLGLDIVNAVRKVALSFETLYLTGYFETAITNISFEMEERCIDFSLPITLYFGRLDTQARPYLFVASDVCLVYGGTLQWTRTHLVDNTVLAHYQMPLSTASSSGYDYGIRAGAGVEIRQQVGLYHLVAKLSLSFYYGLHDTFSDLEKENQLQPDHYLGLGDIFHEQLGERYFRQVSFSCSLSFPFRKRLRDACYNFDKNGY